jgi:hypothetical protein
MEAQQLNARASPEMTSSIAAAREDEAEEVTENSKPPFAANEAICSGSRECRHPAGTLNWRALLLPCVSREHKSRAFRLMKD